MKKTLFLSFALTSCMFAAATNEQIIEHFKSQINLDGLEYKVINRQAIKDYPGFEFATVEFSQADLTPKNQHHEASTKKINIIIKDNFIFPEAIDVTKNKSLREDIENAIFYKTFGTIYQNEDKSNIIFLGNDPKKETIVMFLDPASIYSIKELNNINEYLKNSNIKIILTATNSKNSYEKTSQIYKEIKSTKKDDEKIIIMNKYFTSDETSDIKVEEKEIKRLESLTKKYVDAGLFSIPFIIDEKNLLIK